MSGILMLAVITAALLCGLTFAGMPYWAAWLVSAVFSLAVIGFISSDEAV